MIRNMTGVEMGALVFKVDCCRRFCVFFGS